jgi:hypothetical protein
MNRVAVRPLRVAWVRDAAGGSAATTPCRAATVPRFCFFLGTTDYENLLVLLWGNCTACFGVASLLITLSSSLAFGCFLSLLSSSSLTPLLSNLLIV